MAELAIFGIAADVEINISGRRIREPAINQRLRESQDFVDVVSGLGEMIDRVDAHRVEISHVVGRHFGGQLGHRNAELPRFDDQLVVDVGDIHDPSDLIAAIGEIALDGIEDHRADHVADVARLVNRRPAQIDADAAGSHRHERFLGAAERVVEPQRRDCTVVARWRGGSGRWHLGFGFDGAHISACWMVTGLSFLA